MDQFKKAMVASAAVAIFSGGAYIGLQGLDSTISERFASFLAKREALLSTETPAK